VHWPARVPPGIRTTSLVHENALLAVPDRHPLAQLEYVPLDNLRGQVWASCPPGTRSANSPDRERYLQLLAVINSWSPPENLAPVLGWFIQALRAPDIGVAARSRRGVAGPVHVTLPSPGRRVLGWTAPWRQLPGVGAAAGTAGGDAARLDVDRPAAAAGLFPVSRCTAARTVSTSCSAARRHRPRTAQPPASRVRQGAEPSPPSGERRKLFALDGLEVDPTRSVVPMAAMPAWTAWTAWL
jgi:hypothetical protein